MKKINALLSRRWLSFYFVALHITLLGAGLSFTGSALSYVLTAFGVVVMFCVLTVAEWRGLE